MSVQNPERVVTKQDLKDFYDNILPYLGGSADAGFTPIGTIIAVFSETAPANYLICDGATYNKADYPELAAHLLALTTHSQYEVDGDSTKFKVPDLRGEFLRGTGTNSHSGNGNGANVGTHQDATMHPRITWRNDSIGTFPIDGTNNFTELNSDSTSEIHHNDRNYSVSPSYNTPTANRAQTFSSRPTNTSVLFCIATKNIYMNPSLDYSTDEKVVGSWITGQTIYQKTIIATIPEYTPPTTPSSTVTYEYADISLENNGITNVDNIITLDAVAIMTSSKLSVFGAFTPALNTVATNFFGAYWMGTDAFRIYNSFSAWNNQPIYLTLKYTKTTS